MNDISLSTLLLILSTFVAGGVKGVTGMGLPTVAMGMLGAVISPLAAASLLIVPSFVTNLWQLLAGPAFRPVLRGANGAFSAGMMGLSLLSLAPALIGMWAGQKLRDRISLVTFRRLFLGFLLLLGTEMALRPWF